MNTYSDKGTLSLDRASEILRAEFGMCLSPTALSEMLKAGFGPLPFLEEAEPVVCGMDLRNWANFQIARSNSPFAMDAHGPTIGPVEGEGVRFVAVHPDDEAAFRQQIPTMLSVDTPELHLDTHMRVAGIIGFAVMGPKNGLSALDALAESQFDAAYVQVSPANLELAIAIAATLRERSIPFVTENRGFSHLPSVFDKRHTYSFKAMAPVDLRARQIADAFRAVLPRSLAKRLNWSRYNKH